MTKANTAAIYARKSTEQRGVTDDAKSVSRQIENARLYAVSKGWQVHDEHVFLDDGISGAEFAKRPGLQALRVAAMNRAFRYVIIADQSRLGREAVETQWVLKQLKLSNVEVVGYLDGASLTPRKAIDKVTSAVRAFGDESHREQSAAKSHEAHLSKHARGHVVGGRTFGYRNVDVDSGQTDAHGRSIRSHVSREIVSEEAAVVRRIFEMYASGKGLKRIAKALNDDNALSPRRFVRKDPNGLPPLEGWMPSTVRHLLRNEVYRGIYIWNKTKKRNDDGQQAQQRRPETEWRRTEVPEWRIVSDDLWDRVQSMIKDQSDLALRFSNGKLQGRPPRKAETNLLAGLAQCGVCGGGIVVQTYKTSEGKPRRSHYLCSRKRIGKCRDSAGRTNDLRLELNETNETILATIEKHALTPEAVERVVLLAEQSVQESANDKLRRELQDVEKRIAKLAKAVETAPDIAVLVTRLRDLEARKAALAGELADLRPLPRLAPAMIEGRLAEWRRLLRASITQGRQVLDRVLAGRIVFTPAENAGGCTFNAQTRFGRLFEGYASKAAKLKKIPDWMLAAPEDEPIDPARLPDENYGRLLDRAVERLREKSGMRGTSPPGFEPGFQP
jgi:site-specific DNA recombinase